MKFNKMVKFIGFAAIAALVAVGGTIQTSQADTHHTKDIVDTAVAAGSFNTLAAALKAAGLIDTLKGKGPFTVFAPTDDAFAKLPKGTVESLLKPWGVRRPDNLACANQFQDLPLCRDTFRVYQQEVLSIRNFKI